MVETLYNRDILRLASQIESNLTLSADHINHCIGCADKNAPICGSKASVKAALDSNNILVDAIFTISSCAMGQASTALLIEYMRGQKHDDILAMRTALRDRLNGQKSDVSAWPKLSILDVAMGYKARHGAILLPYDTLLAAMLMAVKIRAS